MLRGARTERIAVQVCVQQHEPEGTHSEVIKGHWMPTDLISPESEVIRAILLADSPCCGALPAPSVLGRVVAQLGEERVGHRHPSVLGAHQHDLAWPLAQTVRRALYIYPG